MINSPPSTNILKLNLNVFNSFIVIFLSVFVVPLHLSKIHAQRALNFIVKDDIGVITI